MTIIKNIIENALKKKLSTYDGNLLKDVINISLLNNDMLRNVVRDLLAKFILKVLYYMSSYYAALLCTDVLLLINFICK